MIEQAKFTFSPIEKAFEKTSKNNWRSRKKQAAALLSLKPDNQLNSMTEQEENNATCRMI